MSRPDEDPEVTDERQSHQIIAEESEAFEEPSEVRVHEDHTRELRTPGFARMRTEWYGEDAAQVAAVSSIVDGLILREFADAFTIMNEVYEIVREPVIHPETGEVLTDQHGWAVWARSADGSFIEDYSQLTYRDKENILFKITTRMFDWKQRQANLWGEAMLAKAVWEERFSHGFTTATGARPTVDDKTNQARASSVEERYFAIFRTLVSRRADAVVSGCELLGQRIKDVLSM